MSPLWTGVVCAFGTFVVMSISRGPEPVCHATPADAIASGLVRMREIPVPVLNLTVAETASSPTSSQSPCVYSVQRAANGSYTCNGGACVFRAQDREDRVYMDRQTTFPVGPTNTILETGALDGVTYSTSWFFEYHLGWRAIHFEPSPRSFHLLARDRPGAINIQRALCSRDDERPVAWIAQPHSGAVDGIEALMAPSFKEFWHPPKAFAEGKSVHTNVTCGPLWRYLAMLGVRHVNVWVLDVEGAELDALRGFRWENVVVDTLVVEEDGRAPAKDAAVRALITARGYTHETIGRNGWYTRNTIRPR